LTGSSAWTDRPGYRIELEPLEGVGRAHAGSTLLAESDRCLILRESDHHDQLYFPVESVRVPLEDSEHRTTCPFKGSARHWSISTDVESLDDVVWSYLDPFDEVAGIRGYVAFYAHRVTVTANIPYPNGTEATARFPIWGTERDLITLMDVQPVVETDGATSYRTPIHPDPPLGTYFDWSRQLRSRNVVEGGQPLGAVIAAAAHARPDLRVTWASIIFTKAAHWDTPLDIELDVRRSGRSIAAMDARIVQDGVLRATAAVMADIGADDIIHHACEMPEVPGPEACPAHDFGVIGRDYRVVDGAYQHQDVAGPPVLYVWTRFARDPGPEHLHQAAHAQASTHWSIAAALRPYPAITEDDAHISVSTGPLALAIAFHDEIDVTEWLLTETQSIYAGRGSSQSQTRTYTVDGRLVASSTVQAMIRPFVQQPQEMGRDNTTSM
jgi:uncharacterized protein (DUF427 family)/acyl-CoA thioesterase